MHVTGPFAHATRGPAATALTIVLASVLVACETPKTAEPAPAAGPDPRAVEAEQAARIRALNDTNAELQLKLLERNAEIARLNEERNEAVQEVVRTKSKLRGLESRAEAASTMAEVEIALKQVKSAAAKANQDPGPGIQKAEQLLGMGGVEFEKGNYGGAIYLATQSKGLIGTRREQIGGQGAALQADEVPFAFPIALESTKRSNVRDGPGLSYGVLATLSADAPLVGLSYKNDWVHVRLEDGRDGWMHYSLVDNRGSDGSR